MDNYLKEILAFVYYDWIVNSQPKSDVVSFWFSQEEYKKQNPRPEGYEGYKLAPKHNAMFEKYYKVKIFLHVCTCVSVVRIEVVLSRARMIQVWSYIYPWLLQ